MIKFVSFFFLVIVSLSLSQSVTNSLLIPKSNTPVINGKIENAEWNSALSFGLNGGTQIFLMHDDEYLYIAFRGVYEPWGHLYLRTREEVSIYHCSAALGKILYKMERSGLWNPDRKFNWKMRNDKSDINNKQKFGEEDSWVASSEFASDKRELEFKISLKIFDKNSLYFASVYGTKDGSLLRWPNTLNDGTLELEYMTGHNPVNLKFNFDQWIKISLLN